VGDCRQDSPLKAHTPNSLASRIATGVIALFLMAAMQGGSPRAMAENHMAASHATGDHTVDASQFVGAETCKGCHEEQFKSVDASPHFQTSLPKVRGDEAHGCESCHGPGAAHVEGGGDKSKIFAFKGVRPEEISRRCMTCH